jgi:hypothetical protein
VEHPERRPEALPLEPPPNLASAQDDPEGSRPDGVSVLSFAGFNNAKDYLVTADHVTLDAHEAELAGEDSEFWTSSKLLGG